VRDAAISKITISPSVENLIVSKEGNSHWFGAIGATIGKKGLGAKQKSDFETGRISVVL
jgi:hypothetical protein